MGVIRESIEAPPGYFLWACDSAQIELRTNLWFCGQLDAIDLIIKGEDIYKIAASEIFHVHVKEITKDQRKLGKARELGLQYRMGWFKFKQWCASGPLGMEPITLSDQQSRQVVDSSRSSKYAIKAMWEWLDGVIPRMAGPALYLPYKCITFSHEQILLPGGSALRFPNLHFNEEYKAWVWGTGPRLHKLHGGKILENIIQALANCIIDEEILTVNPIYRTVSMTHDEILGICRYKEATDCKNFVSSVMSTSPTWAPDLPLGCEFSIGTHYMK